MRKINIHGTAIVVNLSIDAGVKKFCYVSSIAAIEAKANTRCELGRSSKDFSTQFQTQCQTSLGNGTKGLPGCLWSKIFPSSSQGAHEPYLSIAS